jgi:hypothetical protein
MTAVSTDEDDVAAFVARFEDRSWPLEKWHHREHLLLATHYLERFGLEGGLERVRAGIQGYNEAHGTRQTIDSGYHDTVTVFLVRGIHAFLSALPREASFSERAARVVVEFAEARSMVLAHFSRETINSWPARTGVVDPDKGTTADWLAACAALARDER